MRVNDEVRTHLEAIPAPRRRRDAETLTALMERITGQEPRLWGSIVGFGRYHYRYDSGREGDAPAAGFAARKGALTLYVLDGVAAHADLLDRLGPHSTGAGCIYIKVVENVDMAVLEAIVSRSYTTLNAGTHPHRAHESG